MCIIELNPCSFYASLRYKDCIRINLCCGSAQKPQSCCARHCTNISKSYANLYNADFKTRVILYHCILAEILLALNHGRIPLILVGNMGKSPCNTASGQVSRLGDVLPISLKCLFEPISFTAAINTYNYDMLMSMFIVLFERN